MARHRLPAGRGASSSASGVLRPHRPRLSEPQELTHFAGGEDPQEVAAAASRLAHALVAGGRAEEDPAVVERLVGLVRELVEGARLGPHARETVGGGVKVVLRVLHGAQPTAPSGSAGTPPQAPRRSG